MSKYIIEIEEKPLCVFDKDTQTYFPRLWRVKGFNSLVLDEDGLSRLEELNSDYINEHYGQLLDEAYQRGYKDCQTRYCSFDACPNRQAEYQRGLDDAWEAAKKLFSTMSDTEIEKVFPVEWKSGFSGLMQMKPQYAIEKLKAYEEKQNAKIEVGNEVKWNSDVIVVTRLYKDGEHDWCDGIGKDGRAFHVLKENVTKTGRHFIIGSILKEMNDEP